MIKFLIICVLWFALGFSFGWYICRRACDLIIKLDIPDDVTPEDIEKMLEEYFNDGKKDE